MLTAFVAGYIYWVLANDDRLNMAAIISALKNFASDHLWYLIAAVLLVPVNWGLETWKWRRLVRKIEVLSFGRAYAGVLTGLSLGFVTPHSIGDYFGRILQLEDSERSRAVGAVLLSRMSQFLITLVFGAFGMGYYLLVLRDPASDTVLLYALSGIVAGFLVLFALLVNSPAITRSLIRKNRLGIFKPYFEVVGTYSRGELTAVLWIALLRYLVFMMQYYLLLRFFAIGLSLLPCIAGISYVFLLKSVMALNTLTGLGVKEAAALHFFHELLGVSSEKILLPGLTLWLINILLPTIAGLFLLWRIKLLKKRG